MLRDLAFAARSLRSYSGVAAVAALLLALGLAAAAVVFTLVDAYLLRPLPYPGSDRIVTVRWEAEGGTAAWDPRLDRIDWAGADLLETRAAWDLDVFTVLGSETAELAYGAWVSPDYFRVLAVAPALGRPLLDSDVRASEGNVAVISHALWQRRFGGDPEILGTQFRAYVSDRPGEAETFTVVGVLGEDFWPFLRYSDVLAPLREPGFPSLARLAAGVDPEVAGAQLTAIALRQLATEPTPEAEPHGDEHTVMHRSPRGDPGGGRISVVPLQKRYTAAVRPLLLALLLSALVVVVVVAGNAAMLLTVVAGRRERELALRSVLGAERGSVARQLILEGSLIALVAAVLGVALAGLSMPALELLIEAQLGRSAPGVGQVLALDPGALLAVFLVALIVGCGAGAVPALSLRNRDPAGALRSGPGGGPSRTARRTWNLLVGAELALSLGLLLTAGLAARSALHLSRIELGFSPGGVSTASVGLRSHSYPDDAERASFAERLIERVAAAPGVTGFALASSPPFGVVRPRAVRSEGAASVDPQPRASIRSVSSDYFEALSIPLVEGRTFAPSDRLRSERVAIVSRRLAEALWPRRSPIDRWVRFESSMMVPADTAASDAGWRIVGVVGDVRETLIGEEQSELYVPLAQSPTLWLSVILRGELGASAPPAVALGPVRRAVRELDHDATLSAISNLESLVADERVQSRFLAAVLVAFSLFSLVLGTVGLYGVIAQAVQQRRRETAIRLALGALPSRVVVLFLSQATAIVGPALAVGLVVGLGLGRLVSGQLYGVRLADPVTWIAVPLVLTGCGLLATWLPARRAARRSPASTLQAE